MKILTILGARPQFIKVGSISREIAKYDEIDEVIVHTGQHYAANMSDVFFGEMKIPEPDYSLGIGGENHGAMTEQMIEKIEKVCLQEELCITLRDETEWVELVEHGFNVLVGAKKEKILAAYKKYIKRKIENRKLNLYGNGEASKIIVKKLLDFNA